MPPPEEPAPHWDGPPLESWRAWTPDEVARLLEGVDAPWRVLGGWAIDLALGRETREHEDVEIGIAREHLPLFRQALEAQGFLMHRNRNGDIRRLAPDEAPEHDAFQNWVSDPALGVWRLDVMLEPGEAGTWAFRRDPTISAPYDFMVAPRPIPHLRPHGVLLFKAKALRPKDEADFANATPRLSPAERDWLVAALERAHPDHPWIERLRA